MAPCLPVGLLCPAPPLPFPRRIKLSPTQSSSRPDPIRPTPARPELLRPKSGHPRLAVEFLEQPHLATILPSRTLSPWPPIVLLLSSGVLDAWCFDLDGFPCERHLCSAPSPGSELLCRHRPTAAGSLQWHLFPQGSPRQQPSTSCSSRDASSHSHVDLPCVVPSACSM
uniref:Uncharacterized protein n=1 Tax=Zea mays TaxID=4577 RepID=B4FDU7_MAIZE|nr:unknown [Zea mays]|eukprot:NP_001131745.1 uncharacterized protein LOC100193111 [Zea mays]